MTERSLEGTGGLDWFQNMEYFYTCIENYSHEQMKFTE